MKRNILVFALLPLFLTSCNQIKEGECSLANEEERLLVTLDNTSLPLQDGSGYPEDQTISVNGYDFDISYACIGKGKFADTLGNDTSYIQLKKSEGYIKGLNEFKLSKIIIEEYINYSSYAGDLTKEITLKASKDKTNYDVISSTKVVNEYTWTLSYDVKDYKYANFLNLSTNAIYLASISIYGY